MTAKKTSKDIKMFQIRMPRDMWVFLKKTAIDQEVSMVEIIVRCVGKYKKRMENRLTEE